MSQVAKSHSMWALRTAPLEEEQILFTIEPSLLKIKMIQLTRELGERSPHIFSLLSPISPWWKKYHSTSMVFQHHPLFGIKYDFHQGNFTHCLLGNQRLHVGRKHTCFLWGNEAEDGCLCQVLCFLSFSLLSVVSVFVLGKSQ